VVGSSVALWKLWSVFFAADHHLQRARDHLEVFGVGQVVVGCSPPARGDLDLDEGVLATGLLARLQEGRVVLLDRVVDPPVVLLGFHFFYFFGHEFGLLFATWKRCLRQLLRVVLTVPSPPLRR
jgi:hypothetical protein